MGKADIYEIEVLNDALESENRIHSDQIAKKFGFEGALVGGVVVFGHMTYQPMKAAGEDWLTDNQVEVKFLKPAYDKQRLTIECQTKECQTTSDGFQVDCYNDKRTLLSPMSSTTGLGDPNPAFKIEPSSEPIVREEVHWDRLQIDKPAPAHIWHADYDTNMAFSQQLRDDNPLYSDGQQPLVHPFWTSRECNSAFSRSFILPAWIHVGTKFFFRKPLRVGQEIEVRMIPQTKWETKGHQLTTLYIAFLVNGEPYVEAEHTAIFNVAVVA